MKDIYNRELYIFKGYPSLHQKYKDKPAIANLGSFSSEYSYRFFDKPNNNGLAPDSPLYKQPYNNEPSISLGVTYCGWFL